MQTQHISDIYPNIISITEIRKDIDSLMGLLKKYPEVKVLRGQNIVFKVVRANPITKSERKQRIKKAAAFFKNMRKKYKTKPGELSATEWLIRERDRMHTKEYYEEHNR